MPYCVHCGVKLQETEAECPLCRTPVIDPLRINGEAIRTLVPDPTSREGQLLDISRAVNRTVSTHKGVVSGLLSFFFFAGLVISLIVDVSVNSQITWSLYTMISIVTAWFIIWFPIIYSGRSRLTAAVYDLLFIAVYLLIIDNASRGVSWAWYPVVGIGALCGILMIIRFSRDMVNWLVLILVFADLALLLGALNHLTRGHWFLPVALPILAATFIIYGIIALVMNYIEITRTGLSNGYLYGAVVTAALTLEIYLVNGTVSLYRQHAHMISWAHLTLFFLIPILAFCIIAHSSERLQVLLKKKFHL